MPFRPLLPPPGVNTQKSALLNGTAWSSCNLVRWKEQLLQKLGGCARLTSSTIVGTARGMHAFSDLSSNVYLAIGTEQRLQLYNSGNIYDITPLRTTTATALLSSTSGSPSILVQDSGNPGVLPGDWVYIQNATAIGGLLLQGLYSVASIASGKGGFRFVAASTAGSTDSTSGGHVLQFNTTAGQNVVTVAFGGTGFYSFTNGQTITVYFSTAVGGLTIAPGTYTLSGSGANATFVSSTAATSTTSVKENSNTISTAYLLQTQQEGTVIGFGTGPFGQGNYGQSSSYTSTQLRQWTLDNWGQNLIAAPTNGTIYQWVPPLNSPLTPAAALANAPAAVAGCFIDMSRQIIIAYGAYDPVSGQQDPMLVRWCDVGNNTVWIAAANNQAGSFRLPRGAQIVGGIQGPSQGLLWTDLDPWSVQYVGYPLVYAFNQIGWGSPLLNKRAVAKLGAIVYWAGQNEFYSYDGAAVRSIPCPVWDQFFPLLNRGQASLIWAWANSDFDELWWFTPTTYAKLNVRDNLWDYGTLTRTAGVDRSVIGAPIAADNNGLLQQHEVAADLDGVAMDSYATTGWIALGDGDDFMFMERVHADFITTPAHGLSRLTFTFSDYAQGGNQVVKGPYDFASAVQQYQVVRGRGRYVQVRVEWNQLGTFGRLGKLEGKIGPAGRR